MISLKSWENPRTLLRARIAARGSTTLTFLVNPASLRRNFTNPIVTSFIRPGPFPPEDDGVTYCETVTDAQGNVMHFMRRTPKRPQKTCRRKQNPMTLVKPAGRFRHVLASGSPAASVESPHPFPTRVGSDRHSAVRIALKYGRGYGATPAWDRWIWLKAGQITFFTTSSPQTKSRPSHRRSRSYPTRQRDACI